MSDCCFDCNELAGIIERLEDENGRLAEQVGANEAYNREHADPAQAYRRGYADGVAHVAYVNDPDTEPLDYGDDE